MIGAGYAAGLSGRAMRRHLIALAHDRGEVLAPRDGRARGRRGRRFLGAGFGNPLVVDGAKFYDAFLADLCRQDFCRLAIPLSVVAADLHTREALIFTSGPLRPAVAASMAVPGLVRPIEHDGRVLVDGGVVDPLPFGGLRGTADVIVAIDVSGRRRGGQRRSRSVGEPDCGDHRDGGHIVAHKLKEGAPDLVVRPNVGIFRMLDFFQASAILRAAEPIKAEMKTRLGALLS